jgi:hypothetical protein
MTIWLEERAARKRAGPAVAAPAPAVRASSK